MTVANEVFMKAASPLLSHSYRLMRALKRRTLDRKLLAAEQFALQAQWWSPEEVAQHQLEQVQKLIRHAYQTTRYYRELLDTMGITPADIRTRADFEAIPVLEKNVVRERFDDLISNTGMDGQIVERSSGSTGMPMRFVRQRGLAESAALKTLANHFCGIHPGDRTVQFWGRDIAGKFHYMDRLRNFAYFSFYNMTPDRLETAIEFLIQWRPKVVTGYVSVLMAVADALLARGVKGIGAGIVQTHAERLYDYQRNRMAMAFGGEVFDFYGSTEIFSFGSECQAHQGLHLFTPHRIFEIEPIAGDADAGEVLITDLHNPAMPLIRYRNGDVLRINRQSCSCGRSLPRATVDGRTIDIVRTKNGEILYAVFFVELIDPEQVKQFLVHQQTIDKVELLIVPTSAFGMEYGRAVCQKIAERMDAQVSLRLIDAIDSNIGNKYRLLRSDLQPQHKE